MARSARTTSRSMWERRKWLGAAMLVGAVGPRAAAAALPDEHVLVAGQPVQRVGHRVFVRIAAPVSVCCSALRKDCSSGRRCCCSPSSARSWPMGGRGSWSSLPSPSLRFRRTWRRAGGTGSSAPAIGHRAFTDALPLAAVLLAACFRVGGRQRVVARRFVTGIAAALVALSIAQMVQYWTGKMPIANTTWQEYRDSFLRFR